MSIWLGITIVIACLILAVLYSRIHMKLDIAKHENDDRARLEIRLLYGIIKMNYDIPSIVMANIQKGLQYRIEQNKNIDQIHATVDSGTITKKKVQQFLADVKKILKGTTSFKRWLRKTVAHVSLSKLEWSTNIGLADAAHTAVSTGILWAVKTTLIGTASHFVRVVCIPKLFVVPYWVDRFRFTTVLCCEASVSLGFVLYAMLGLSYRIIRAPGGIQAWKRVMSRKK